ncbi:GrpB family protein [Planktotalea sp.]|uniref:GrpB family protein n=1 Tax=Planktotalea sp. TaxID=2029877 RepID=UPI003D6B18F3
MDFVVPHDPNWAADYRTEAEDIRRALTGLSIELHHIGSTAVPGVLAKPIIDIMGVASDLAGLDRYNANLERLGYEVMGELGIPNRRFFRKITAEGLRTHHLHVFLSESPHVVRHIAFRDYLRATPEIATKYCALKAALTKNEQAGWDAYLDGKERFVIETEAQALVWWQSNSTSSGDALSIAQT